MVRSPISLTLLLLCSVTTWAGQSRPGQGLQFEPHPDKIGIELDGIGDGSRCMPFIDLARTTRPSTKLNSGELVATDSNGWPTADCQSVLFDIRPFPAWNPPIDDPEKFMPDWSGTYHLSLTGQAEIASGEGDAKVQNFTYNSATNKTRVDVTIPKGTGLLILKFSHTRRTASSPEGTGFTNLKVLRPGYEENSRQVFTDEYVNALKPFAALRFMDVLATNHNPGYYGDTGHHALEWKDRRLPSDATQVETGNKYGLAWEYIVNLANQTGRDAWINIPIAATDDYVRQLAQFLKGGLKPKIRIYIEHSNEVWNFGFPQYIYNKLAAIDEVKKGGSVLNNDGSQDQEVWTHRRHLKRLHDIAMIFKGVFGSNQMLTRVRPIYASWLISPDAHFKDVLQWGTSVFGEPKSYLYGIAAAAYYSDEKSAKDATPEQVLVAMRKASDENMKFHTQLKPLADQYGLKYTQYEIGPDSGGGRLDNIANRIRANRIPGMRGVVLHDATSWFAMGGDMYMYFASPGAYSRYGCWGLSEDIRQLNTPKWQAIYLLTGTPMPK